MTSGAHRPIVVFGDDWGRHVSSMQHVFRPIVGRRPVVWVNAIGHRVPSVRGGDLGRAWEMARGMLHPTGRRARPAPDGLEGPRPLSVIRPRVLPWHHRRVVHAFNTWSLLRAIRGALRRHDLVAPPILVTGTPPSVGVVGRLGEVGSVYFCMDDFLHLPGVTPWMIAPLEQRLLERVDALVATAASLTQSKRPRSGRVHHLPQGVNYEHFAAPRAVPSEIAALPGPRIGFAGGVSAACDIDILQALAAAFPNGSVVLVGPVSIDVEPLRAANIHLLGRKSYADLPAYVQAFDVGIVPYVLNEWTEAVDPLKLLEYLAAGLPVVTTALPEARKYAEVVRIAESRDAFTNAVRAALADDRDVARSRGQELARRHTWAKRADELLAILDDVAMRARPSRRAGP